MGVTENQLAENKKKQEENQALYEKEFKNARTSYEQGDTEKYTESMGNLRKLTSEKNELKREEHAIRAKQKKEGDDQPQKERTKERLSKEETLRIQHSKGGLSR